MSTSKHTPGPWEVSGGYVMPGNTADLAPDGPVPDGIRASGTMFAVALVYAPTRWRDGNGQEVQEANARLISTAPELLEALKGVVRVADRETDEFIAARAAIAKAEGR